MISLIRAAWQEEMRVPMFVGLSTDGYPDSDDPAMRNGARITHIDTGEEYEYSVDDDTWYLVPSGGGGGEGGTTDHRLLTNRSAANQHPISAIQGLSDLIPTQATSTNQLADKDFVNSTVGTNTANYISKNGQPFASLAELEAYTGTVTNNDYAFVVGADSAGNTTYTRYKYNANTEEWASEYVLNNSSFTAVQWAAIESGITAALVDKLNGIEAGAEVNDVTDIQINGSSVVNNKIANIPIAGSATLGVVKQTTGYGITINSDGRLQTTKATDALIEGKANDYAPIVPANMQKAFDTCIPDNTFITSQTTAPTAAATDGGIHLVYLDSEPTTKYDGYLYFIREA